LTRKKFSAIKELELDVTYEENYSILNNVMIYTINTSEKSTIFEAIYLCLIVAFTHNLSEKNLSLFMQEV